MSGRRIRNLLFSLGLMVFVIGAAAPVAAAGPDTTTLTLELKEPAKPDIPYYLMARLVDAEGTGISGESVSFYRKVEILGARLAYLGDAETDSTGVAKVAFNPSKETSEILVRFDGTDEFAAGETAGSVTVPPEAVSSFGGDDVDTLEPLRVMIPRLMAVLVALIWIGLIWIVLSTTRTIRREAERA